MGLTHIPLRMCHWISWCLNWKGHIFPNFNEEVTPAILFDEGPMLETLDYTIRIGSTPTILYFDLYLYSAYAVHYVYIYPISCAVYKCNAQNLYDFCKENCAV